MKHKECQKFNYNLCMITGLLLNNINASRSGVEWKAIVNCSSNF